MKATTDTRGENVGNRVKTYIQPRQTRAPAGQPEILEEGNGKKCEDGVGDAADS